MTTLLLAGCAGGAAQVNLNGYTSTFERGYTDGCESAAGELAAVSGPFAAKASPSQSAAANRFNL